MSKVDLTIRAKTLERTVLHVKLIKGVQGVPLVYKVLNIIKMSHFHPRSAVFLNLDKKTIARVPIVDALLNLWQTQEYDTSSINAIHLR